MDTHKILIFDCCRGKKSLEMGSGPSFQLKVMQSELSDLKNAEFKNSYALHATLPDQVSKGFQSPFNSYNPSDSLQVAWCEEAPMGGTTKFSKYFCQALEQEPPVPMGLLDEFINERLDREDASDTGGHKQMVQMDKRVVRPFKW